MPAAVAIPLITAAVSGGTAIVGAKMASNANRRATDAQTASTDKALAFEREQEQRRREEYDREQRAMQAQWDADQARKGPYRELAESLLRRRAARVGINLGASAAQAPTSSGSTARMPGATPTLGSLAGRTEYGQATARRPVLTPTQLSDLVRQRRGY